MLETLKEEVFEANRELVRQGLVTLTWGNASAISADRRHLVIKPSGVPYDKMKPADMVVLNINDGQVADGTLRPSSDTPTHLHLYREFPEIGGIVHTHSLHATACAQLRAPIPCHGTTHADHFHGPIPVTRALTEDEVNTAYEHNTGCVIAEWFRQTAAIAPLEMPAILVAGHGPFTWGETVAKAVENAVALEAVAKMSLEMRQLTDKPPLLENYILEKHYHRKHGKGAYYGQSDTRK